ncbi:MAG: hypothetical protein GTN64_05680 [Candidatus Latescibacteria bacterium]|nr:hypothetical protein [Candidatus Latescibacterota bacterium]NIO78100.1 hypothetical protein [Candidatus Latescibacterota bacterium]
MIDPNLFDVLQGERVILFGGSDNFDLPKDHNEWFHVWTNNHWLKHQSMPIQAAYESAAEPPLGEYPSDSIRFLAGAIDSLYSSKWQLTCDEMAVPFVPYLYKRYFKPNPYGAQFEWYNRLYADMGTQPFTAMVAAHHLLFYPIHELWITGCTFYYDRERQRFPIKRGPHHVGKNRDWLTRLAYGDKRVKLDGFLTEHCTMERPELNGHRITEWDKETRTVWAWEPIPVKVPDQNENPPLDKEAPPIP